MPLGTLTLPFSQGSTAFHLAEVSFLALGTFHSPKLHSFCCALRAGNQPSLLVHPERMPYYLGPGSAQHSLVRGSEVLPENPSLSAGGPAIPQSY